MTLGSHYCCSWHYVQSFMCNSNHYLQIGCEAHRYGLFSTGQQSFSTLQHHCLQTQHCILIVSEHTLHLPQTHNTLHFSNGASKFIFKVQNKYCTKLSQKYLVANVKGRKDKNKTCRNSDLQQIMA
jgi:hypothetical protein